MKLMVAIDAPQHQRVVTHYFELGLYVPDFCFLIGNTVPIGALDAGISFVDGIIDLADEGILILIDCGFFGAQ
jgi:hypothetical protein